MRTIPRSAESAGRIVLAIVDDADYEDLGRWSWFLHDQGYAFRSLSARSEGAAPNP